MKYKSNITRLNEEEYKLIDKVNNSLSFLNIWYYQRVMEISIHFIIDDYITDFKSFFGVELDKSIIHKPEGEYYISKKDLISIESKLTQYKRKLILDKVMNKNHPLIK